MKWGKEEAQQVAPQSECTIISCLYCYLLLSFTVSGSQKAQDET